MKYKFTTEPQHQIAALKNEISLSSTFQSSIGNPKGKRYSPAYMASTCKQPMAYHSIYDEADTDDHGKTVLAAVANTMNWLVLHGANLQVNQVAFRKKTVGINNSKNMPVNHAINFSLAGMEMQMEFAANKSEPNMPSGIIMLVYADDTKHLFGTGEVCALLTWLERYFADNSDLPIQSLCA
jgi:hypothetical protein